jgi:nucleoid-associated protein YgaU
MAPNNLTITPVGGTPITVMFNPNSYSIGKTVEWNAPKASTGSTKTDVKANAQTPSFGGGDARSLSLELFFDTTELNEQARDVRLQTEQIARLTEIKNGRPPVCDVAWGKGTPFRGMISSLTQRFVLFYKTGTPLRAWLAVTFTEFRIPTDDKIVTGPETSTRVVRRGDSLASIAAEVYRDATAWRLIANANRIEDPFVLPPGSTITSPKK